MFDETLDETVKSAPKRVGFGPRLGAFLIDNFILVLIIQILIVVISNTENSDFFIQKGIDSLKLDDEIYSYFKEVFKDDLPKFLMTISITSTITLIYNLFEAFIGASPGKMIIGIKIANNDGTKGDINLFIKRWALKYLNSLISIINLVLNIGVIDFFGAIFWLIITVGCFATLSINKLALHDILAGTAVFRKKDIVE